MALHASSCSTLIDLARARVAAGQSLYVPYAIDDKRFEDEMAMIKQLIAEQPGRVKVIFSPMAG